MFKPNCLILTLAPEICLKSKQVRIFYEKFLKKNIIEYLKFDEVEYTQILVRSGRMYIFSTEVEKVKGVEYQVIQLDVSSASHPFFTGKQKLVDTSGRVERFKRQQAQAEK